MSASRLGPRFRLHVCMSVEATGRNGSRSVAPVADEVDLIAQARERSERHAERRELYTEAVASAGFVGACAATVALFGVGGVDLALVAWLTAITAILVRVEFEVGEGCTRPLQLVFAPMLVLLPPALIAPVVVLGHVVARLPDVVARRFPPRRVFMGLADSWFAVPPAVAVALIGLPADAREAAVLVAVALAGAVRLRLRRLVAARPHRRRRGAAVAAAAVRLGLSRRSAPAPDRAAGRLGRLPRGARPGRGGCRCALLLAIFARERRGRIDNAVALQRMTEESQGPPAVDRAQRVGPDRHRQRPTGRCPPSPGRSSRSSARTGETAEGMPLLDYVHPDDAGLVRAFLQAVAAKAAGRIR